MVRQRCSEASSDLVEDDSMTVVRMRFDELDGDDPWLKKRELLRDLSVEGRDRLESVPDLLEIAVR